VVGCIFFIFNNLYGQTDSLKTSSKKLSPNAVQSSVKYISQDSIIIHLLKKKILLFQDAKAYYEDIELTSDFMEFGFTDNELYASGVADSSGHIHGHPVFKQGDTEFRSQEMRYNFKSKKAKVTKVITVEGEGYIHGYNVKHVDDKTSYIKGGQYTTCNLEHPHFQIRFNKAKVIQDDKIVTGPAYFSFGDVPAPLAIPFSLFPLNKDRASGIVLPKFGEGTVRGFYFEDFGYYFGINDNFDLLLSGDISTRLNWAAKANSNYVFRYKCNGAINLTFSQNFKGERGTPEQETFNDFRIYWKHNQDPKSHPTTRFAAHINVITSGFNKYNPSSASDYLSNQFTSSLSVSTNAKGILFFEGAVYYTQNTHNKTINLSLPDINMNVRQFYPFRKKLKVGKLRWYDNISMQWSTQMANRIDTKDSLFFMQQTWNELQTGMQHRIPVTIPIKIGKAINWNTNATLVEKWYLQRDIRIFDPVIDTTKKEIVKYSSITKDIFQRGFSALHDLNLSTALTTKIFFQWNFKKGGFKAIRHVMSPDLSFNYSPNLSKNAYGFYTDTIQKKDIYYSYYERAIYRGVSQNTQAVARFTLNNNIEIKVKSKKDTITGTRKITLFDYIGISCGYDFAADSLQWQPLSISGRTSLFSFLDINFRFGFDPYIISSEGKRINKKELHVNKRPMRFSGSDLNFSVNWRFNQDFFTSKKKEGKRKTETQQSETIFNSMGMPSARPDFNNPWNVTLNYTFTYATSDNYNYYNVLYFGEKKYNSNIIQTVSISADVSITRKWKLGITSGYDIQNKDFTYTRFEIYRDLHCWEMKFECVPFGPRKEWRFQINVKASVLQDLKYKMENSFRDNY